MMSFINIARTLLAKIVSGLYIITTVFGAGLPVNVREPSKTPDDFSPVIRFAVCSDVHLNGEEDQEEAKRLADMINFMYDYSSGQSYKNFDAIAFAGDVATTGLEIEYDLFNKIIEDNLHEETKLLICTGNHEYISTRDVDASEGARLWERKIGQELDNHFVINGYHFILASYCDDGKTFKDKLDWIDSQVQEAVSDNSKNPVFVFQHPGPFATVYGSVNWGDFDITKVLRKYPQIIDFSGHSHYPINDPRSIWQGGYTALGCGTLSYFETELDAIAGNFPYDYHQAAQFYIVEADAEGNVRILSYDLITNQFFDNEYYLTGLADKNFEYSYSRMKKRDTPPEWPENTEFSTEVNEDGETVLSFTGATDKYVVESYKVSVTRNGMPFFNDNFSGKYMYLFEENSYDVNLGVLSKGKYSVQVVALNAYAETSKPVYYTFTVD